MDSAAPPQTIESSPQRLAVGVRTSELGWIEIRINNDAGQVSATVATNSADAHPALTGQLSSMREYLVGQNVHVDHLAWESFPASSDQREGSSGERSPDGGGTRGAKVPDQAISGGTGTASADADAESLSYINVRV
jgi:flagellar hook-length control protein FliK